jgi:hypothetical protein
MIERIAEAVSTPSRTPRQYMPPWHCCGLGAGEASFGHAQLDQVTAGP